MMNWSFFFTLNQRRHTILQVAIGLLFCLTPIFINLPYKINLYLAWEGAYRMSIGQMPFRDFGMPLGYGFWIIPSIFFKIFGPWMSSLIKAQAFINALSLVSFHYILKALKVDNSLRTIGILIFCISYIFIHFWPWYNHTVFMYELIGMALLLNSVTQKGYKRYLLLVLSGVMIFLSFFTKQDIGGLAFLFGLIIATTSAIYERDVRVVVFFLGGFILAFALFVLPLLQYDFSYWFNFGQPPHSSRISLMDYLDDTFGVGSNLIRVYLLLIFVRIFMLLQSDLKAFINDKHQVLLVLVTLGFVVQALLAQVTAYIPANAHYYYHSFAVVFLLSSVKIEKYLYQPVSLLVICALIVFTWSNDFWKYGRRIVNRLNPTKEVLDYSRVSKKTWIIKNDTLKRDRSDWVNPPYKTFDNVTLPKSTVEGIGRLVGTYKGKKDLKVLNMTELPQLAHELGYEPLKGAEQPLWYHQSVAFFDREVSTICDNISKEHYDLVLFEIIPELNRFYPPDVLSCAKENYELEDRFLAPRSPENAFIEVYRKR